MAADRHTIATAPDGQAVTLTGVVATADEALAGPITGQTCVVYEVHDPHSHALRDEGACDFFVVDESGRARVETQHVKADLMGHLRHQQIAAIDADVVSVGERLGELKDRSRQLSGPAAKELHAEMRRLKRVATLLCCMKAHARGKTHGGMTSADQTALIARERDLLTDGDGESGKLALIGVDRIEALLVPGQRVRVRGVARWRVGADPSRAQGYRDAGKGLVITGTQEQPVVIELSEEERRHMRRRGARDLDEEPTAPGSEQDLPASRRGRKQREGSLATTEKSSPWLLAIAVGVFVLSLLYALTR